MVGATRHWVRHVPPLRSWEGADESLGPHTEIPSNLRGLASGGAEGSLTLIAALAQL